MNKIVLGKLLKKKYQKHVLELKNMLPNNFLKKKSKIIYANIMPKEKVPAVHEKNWCRQGVSAKRGEKQEFMEENSAHPWSGRSLLRIH